MDGRSWIKLKEDWDNIITINNHTTKKFYGPLKKWVPNSLHMAFLMYSLMPLRESELFIVSHTPTDHVCAAHILQCACRTFGHPGAVPDTKFVRKLFATYAATKGPIDETAFSSAVQELADVDAHTAAMALSIHYNLSDRVTGSVIKKSLRSYWNTMKRMPLEFPDAALSQDEFHNILSNMGKRSFKRKASETESDEEPVQNPVDKKKATEGKD